MDPLYAILAAAEYVCVSLTRSDSGSWEGCRELCVRGADCAGAAAAVPKCERRKARLEEVDELLARGEALPVRLAALEELRSAGATGRLMEQQVGAAIVATRENFFSTIRVHGIRNLVADEQCSCSAPGPDSLGKPAVLT